MIQINNIRVPFDAADQEIRRKISSISRIPEDRIQSVRILRRALDARKKNEISYLMNAAVVSDAKSEIRALSRNDPDVFAYLEESPNELEKGTVRPSGRIVVAGLGPAGLFATYILAKEGYRPFVVERGKRIEERVRDVETFWNSSLLNENSNVMFGEGGAGTFSDGKLTSRSKDPRGSSVLRVLAEHGAPHEILYEAKPHIGTDRLRDVVKNLRNDILNLGGEIRFCSRLNGVFCRDGHVTAVGIATERGSERIECDALVLAIGQGARDTYRMLAETGFAMEAKPFAVGCRIEHPQKLIDRAQFGEQAGHPALGAAEYRLTARSGNRGVYTFCMCPGGLVVASSSSEGQVVVNGMSNYLRDAENANSAVVVQVGPEDFGTDPFDGIAFCERLERMAFLAGGGTYAAPVTRVEDFLNGTGSKRLGGITPTYRPGTVCANLWEVLPDYIAAGLSEGIRSFGRKLEGFDCPDAVLTGVETRTSSPVRILRGESGESVSFSGIYPVGEGAGYAGGIVSAAIDGMKAAERIISKFAPF